MPSRSRARSPRQPSFDWIVFTSANAVDAFMTMLLDGTRDVRALKGPRLCAVGTGTADALARHGIKVDLVPREFRAEGVVAALAEQGSARRRARAAAASRHRPRGHRRRAAGGRRGRSPRSSPTAPCCRTASARTIPTSTRCCSKGASTSSRSRAPRRCATSRESTAPIRRRPAEEHRGGRDRTGHRRSRASNSASPSRSSRRPTPFPRSWMRSLRISARRPRRSRVRRGHEALLRDLRGSVNFVARSSTWQSKPQHA